MDLFLGWRSFYIFVMKILFISITAYTIYLMRYKKPFCLSYDKDSDSFPHYYIYLAGLLMAVIIHKSLNPMDFIWSFSIWLEAFAILPQLMMINKLKDIENITAHYVLFLGLYRIFYIFHWYLCFYLGFSTGNTS
jgi:ER lumen protein retaining receptor